MTALLNDCNPNSPSCGHSTDGAKDLPPEGAQAFPLNVQMGTPGLEKGIMEI